MMMYQILCGHVNYALGKTRMQVKKQKDTLFWMHVYINLLKILKSYCHYSILSIFHIIITVLLLRIVIIITTTVVQSLFFNCRGIHVDTGLSAVRGLDKERPLG